MMHLAQETSLTRAGFKVICDACGSLSIKLADTKSGSQPLVHCGRCDAVRGTLAELHNLAHAGTVDFEL
jgi:hypothetical protein